jgi:type III restriction enzyme
LAGSIGGFRLRLRDRLACSVDLATGTGKSYVIYGLARILMNEGTADRVLVLCPSTTIDNGLLDKFRALTADKELRDALPKRSGVRNPDVIQATSTIGAGKICVENIHATYSRTRSAIDDSLRGRGATTLVLNDEAHHIYTPGTDRALKKWQGFLEDSSFGFRRIVGFSGTCYIGNDYFPDVVYRYSLAEAMEAGRVKKVWYVDQDTTKTENEAFQKIQANHESNRKRYRPLKPLTIPRDQRHLGG